MYRAQHRNCFSKLVEAFIFGLPFLPLNMYFARISQEYPLRRGPWSGLSLLSLPRALPLSEVKFSVPLLLGRVLLFISL